MKKFLNPILAVVVFALMQVLVSVVIMVVNIAINGGPELAAGADGAAAEQITALPIWVIGLATALSGVLTVVALSLMKMINWKTVLCWKKGTPGGFWLPIVAAVAAFFAIDVLVELLQLEDILENEFAELSKNWMGILAICIVGPIAEEFCFREAILGGMLRKKVNPWVAILFSSLLFGLIHGNPVQIVGAGLMGVVFGLVYYKTGNIVLPCIIHILNNSTSTIMSDLFGIDATFTDLLGGTTPMVISGIIAAVFAIALFARYYKIPTDVTFEEVEKEAVPAEEANTPAEEANTPAE